MTSPLDIACIPRPTSILTYTGKMVPLIVPNPDLIDLKDIAWSLAGTPRYTSHTKRPYSVAEHCLMLEHFAGTGETLEALMHDASEAYLGDVSGPLKNALLELDSTAYMNLEHRWEAALQHKFGYSPMSGEVKRLDRLSRFAEMAVLMPHHPDLTTAYDALGSDDWQIVDAMRSWLPTRHNPPLSRATIADLFQTRAVDLMAERWMASLEERAAAVAGP